VTAGGADLFATASAAWQQGRRAEAAQLLEALIAEQPDHLAAHNTLALIAINEKDAASAIRHLESAAAIEPSAPGIWFNLYQAHDLSGDGAEAMASLDRALAFDPYFVPAVLKKAELLERTGRSGEALAMYRALIAATPGDLPEQARQALAPALAAVRADDERRAAEVAEPLERVLDAYPEADFHRAQAYAEQRTGRRKVYVQQPVGGHFPYLPAIEFFPEVHFPWFAALEARTGEIRAELEAMLAERDGGFRPYVAFDPTQPVNQWAELNQSRRWSAWFFWEDGVRNDDHCARCPATAAALETAPLLDLPGKGPTAMFSILEPRTRIPPHTGSNNVRTTVHLPLIVPPGCGLRVGAETRVPQAGKAWAFDDTIEHEAWNDSDELRAVLILDVWNPLLSEPEKAAVRVIG
jgi:aspartate beta-hydroxylase